jgi:MotA/TolQ/ExbB proton channel family.
MSLITILLAALLFAAWKAPRWVKEIGLAAPVVALLSLLFGLFNAFDALQKTAGVISPSVVFGGLKVSTIPIIYGLLVYLLSLIIRIIRKPRI